jgi:ribosome-binding protein aMBF1 (putative translation factor)
LIEVEEEQYAPAAEPAGVFFRSAMPKRRRRGSSADRETSDLVQFAAEVRAGRAVLGWSQTELARRTAVTQRAIYCIEQNVVQPRKQTEERIIEAVTDAGLRFERLSNGGFKWYRLSLIQSNHAKVCRKYLMPAFKLLGRR